MSFTQTSLVSGGSGNIVFQASGSNGNGSLSAFFCNYSGSAVTISLHIVKSPGTATPDNTNIIISSYTIPAGDTYTWDSERLAFDNQDTLKAVVSASSAVVSTVSYVAL